MHDHDGKPLVPLPPVEVVVVKVELDAETREFYNAVEEQSRLRVAELVAGASTDAVSPLPPPPGPGHTFFSILTECSDANGL